MSSERKDEFLSWRGRLDSPEGVPGQGLDDHEQTWQRLTDRLREKPRRRLPIWRRLSVYGIVAACLLLAVIPASRLFHDKPSPGRFEGLRKASSPIARPDGGPEVYTSVSPAAPGAPAGVQGRRPAGSIPARPGGVRPKTDRGFRMDIRTVAVTNDTVRMPEAPAVPLVSQLPSAGPSPQKRWKVVDLNELISGWQPPHSMASNFLPGSLRIGPGRPEPGPDGGPVPEKPALRISLSP